MSFCQPAVVEVRVTQTSLLKFTVKIPKLLWIEVDMNDERNRRDANLSIITSSKTINIKAPEACSDRIEIIQTKTANHDIFLGQSTPRTTKFGCAEMAQN